MNKLSVCQVGELVDAHFVCRVFLRVVLNYFGQVLVVDGLAVHVLEDAVEVQIIELFVLGEGHVGTLAEGR